MTGSAPNWQASKPMTMSLVSNGDGSDGAWGVGHLSAHPITLTFGMVLLGVLVLLVILRLAFGGITVRGGVK